MTKHTREIIVKTFAIIAIIALVLGSLAGSMLTMF
jgi:hypothetical protein